MTTRALGTALTAYRKALDPLQTGQAADESQVLTILNARDRLHTGLLQSPPPATYLLSEIHVLDRQLQEHATALAAQLDFSAYRHSFPKSSEQWWWRLDET